MVVLLAFILIGSVIYMGGYWENMPGLDKISGPKRFRQYVTNPIPKTITNLKGGYSGFPQGRILTNFNYSGKFSDNSFLENWEKFDNYDSTESFTTYIDDINANAFYRKKYYKSYIYLLINSDKKEGILLLL